MSLCRCPGGKHVPRRRRSVQWCAAPSDDRITVEVPVFDPKATQEIPLALQNELRVLSAQ